MQRQAISAAGKHWAHGNNVPRVSKVSVSRNAKGMCISPAKRGLGDSGYGTVPEPGFSRFNCRSAAREVRSKRVRFRSRSRRRLVNSILPIEISPE